MFFAFFGAAWILLGAYAFGQLSKVVTLLVGAGTALLIILAVRFRGQCKEAAEGAFPEEERRRNDRIFGIINGVTWTLVFFVFLIFPRLGRVDLAFPSVVLLVGLHFFPMPALYRHRANLVLGACMVVWAIVCPLLFQGDRMIGFVTGGAGLALWVSAAWALKTAWQILRK
jgi:hypothetical protein